MLFFERMFSVLDWGLFEDVILEILFIIWFKCVVKCIWVILFRVYSFVVLGIFRGS